MKKTFTGWIGKVAIKENLPIIIADLKRVVNCREKFPKDSWGKDEWPPIKVKTTVETVEK